MRRWAAAGVLVVVTAAACGADTEPVGTVPTATTDADDERFGPTGVADAFEPASQPDWYQGLRDLPAGVELGIDGCRWRAPGTVTYDLTWQGGQTEDYPLDVPLVLMVARGDTGTGGGGVVTLRETGSFSVTIDLNTPTQRPDQPPTSSWEASRYEVPDPARTGCLAQLAPLAVPDSQHRSVDRMGVDLVEPAATEPGTLEALAAAADPFDRVDRLVPLPYLLAHPDLPAIDRLFLPADALVDHIHVEQDGSCLSVEIQVSETSTADAPKVIVQQRLACPPPYAVAEEEAAVGVADDVWDVRVVGPPDLADRVARQVEPVFSGTVDRFDATAGAFDPDTYIDALLAERDDTVEIARFAWQDGKVAVVRRGDSDLGEAYADPIVAVPDGYNGAAGGTACREFLIHSSTDGRRGFTLVVLHRPDLEVTLTFPDGQTRPVELEPAARGRRAALLDTGAAQLSSTDLTVTDASGAPVPCDQRTR